MSSYLFPYSLPGIQFNYTRKYLWNTGVQQALSGKQSTIVYQQYPLVNFEYSFEFLMDSGSTSSVWTADSIVTADTTLTADAGSSTAADLSALVGLINAVRGRGDTFLHTDPDFNTISPAQAAQFGAFGTGDGETLSFQLIALYQNAGGPGVAEIIQNLNGTPILYSNGTGINPSVYSIGATGIVTFISGHAPASGAALTWSGSWYYRCRFDADDYDFKKKYMGIWTLDKINFTSVLL